MTANFHFRSRWGRKIEVISLIQICCYPAHALQCSEKGLRGAYFIFINYDSEGEDEYKTDVD